MNFMPAIDPEVGLCQVVNSRTSTGAGKDPPGIGVQLAAQRLAQIAQSQFHGYPNPVITHFHL